MPTGIDKFNPEGRIDSSMPSGWSFSLAAIFRDIATKLNAVITFINNGGGGGTGTVDVQEEGATVVTAATILNFTGDTVTASSGAGTTAIINVDAQQPIDVQDEGVSVVVNPSVINFTGPGVTATNPTADEVQVDIQSSIFGVPPFTGNYWECFAIAGGSGTSGGNVGTIVPNVAGVTSHATVFTAGTVVNYTSQEIQTSVALSQQGAAVYVVAGITQYLFRGASTGQGGFEVYMIVGTPSTGFNTDNEYRFGLIDRSLGIAGPSGQNANQIGFGVDAGSTDYVIYHQTFGSGITLTPLTTASSKAASQLFYLTFKCPPNANYIAVKAQEITNFTTAVTLFDGNITTTLPANDQGLTPIISVTSASAASAIYWNYVRAVKLYKPPFT